MFQENTRKLALVFFGLVLAGCEPSPEIALSSRQDPIIPLDTGIVSILSGEDTFEVSVEIAEEPDQREIGLMKRRALPEKEGMLFLFREERSREKGFWMYRTRIPLAIAYMDSAGVIINIQEMEPCPHSDSRQCPGYFSERPYWSALEANPEFFRSRGISPGSRILLRGRGTP